MVQLINDKIVHQGDVGAYYDYAEMLEGLATSSEPTAALFDKGILSRFPEYHCKIAVAYKFPQPSYVSLAFAKSSPYTELFRYELLKMSEQGLLDIINQEHRDIKTECEELARDTPLSIVKLISLFGILATGMAGAVIMIVFEVLFKRTLIDEMSIQVPGANFMKVGAPTEDKREDEVQRFLFKWGKQGQDAFIMDLHRLMKMK